MTCLPSCLSFREYWEISSCALQEQEQVSRWKERSGNSTQTGTLYMDGVYILFSYRSVCLRAHRCWGNRRSAAQTGRGLSPSHVPRCQCLEALWHNNNNKKKRDQAIEKEYMHSHCSLSLSLCVCVCVYVCVRVWLATSLGLVAMGSRERETVWCSSEGRKAQRAYQGSQFHSLHQG